MGRVGGKGFAWELGGIPKPWGTGRTQKVVRVLLHARALLLAPTWLPEQLKTIGCGL